MAVPGKNVLDEVALAGLPCFPCEQKLLIGAGQFEGRTKSTFCVSGLTRMVKCVRVSAEFPHVVGAARDRLLAYRNNAVSKRLP